MPKQTKAPAADASTPTEAKTPNKIDFAIALLSRPEGATIEQLSEATGWQAHSVRGAIAGTLKKKKGLTVTSEKVGDVRIYRIPVAAS